ncbi:hypothetical protein [Rhizobium sp. BG4]|uniref:hypothetical protein n=1 Tax=Rhizobium sp. BG4 TaxID=2613770 RepID=UPI00193D6CAA|nr:hypothetical protein [Rhizobium sp. BG4]QRM43979.1 hypothetical protein F2982_11275 [Rhizobium sp. BG4]
MNRRSFLAALLAAPFAPVIASRAVAKAPALSPFIFEEGQLSLSVANIGKLSADRLYDPRKESVADFEKRRDDWVYKVTSEGRFLINPDQFVVS